MYQGDDRERNEAAEAEHGQELVDRWLHVEASGYVTSKSEIRNLKDL